MHEVSRSDAFAPVSVGIPTCGRGDRILNTLKQIFACNPRPMEIFVFIDEGDKRLAERIERSFPRTQVLIGGPSRVGPGGGRHVCISVATQPFFVSFDDDSYPVDKDFFAEVVRLFNTHTDAAVIGATIWHPDETQKPRNELFDRTADFTGCGHSLRLSAYRQIRGYLPRPIAYAMEETDVAIQLFARGWKIFRTGALRVFHDTDRAHHGASEITTETIANIALFAYLHYPLFGWPRGCLQVINKLFYCVRVGRTAGMVAGLLRIPSLCRSFRVYRSPLPWPVVRQFLALRTAKQA